MKNYIIREKNYRLHLKNLQETQKQHIHSEKMASIGVLVSGIAHEINNPLNFISGGVFGLNDYLKENLPEEISNVKVYTESINEGIERAAKIVKSLGHYNNKTVSKIFESNIHSVLDNCLNILRNQITDNVDIERKYFDSSFLIRCNEGDLHQAIFNVLINAIQSIEEKGFLRIETASYENKLRITIEDSGIGISKENLSKIFDPFFTTKEPGEGIGLGLSITYKIIEEHNGTIEIESEIKKGTKVQITLPVN